MFADRNSRLHAALPLLLAILPPVFIGVCIFVYGVDFPNWDEWIIGGYLDKFAHNTLSIRDLFQQQNGYRQFFPNLIFVSLGWLTSWDVRSGMWASLLFACLISSNIYQLGKWSFPRNPRWTFLIANLLIFSPIQYDNWLQGQQLIYFLPIACLTSSLLIATADRLSTRTKFVVCAVMSIISSFSAGNGMLCWILLLPILTWPWSRRELGGKKWWILAWLLAFLFTAVVYFYDFPALQTEPVPGTKASALQAIRFLLVLLGEPLAVSRFYVPFCIGLFLISLFAWSCWRFWNIQKRSLADAQRMLCWLLIGAYSIVTAVLITIGRPITFRPYPFTPPRYTTYCIYLPVALIYLLPLARGEAGRQLHLFRFKFSSDRLLASLGAAVILVHLLISLMSVRRMRLYQVDSMQNKACASFVNVVDDVCLRENVFPDPDTLKQNINAVNRLGFIRPALITTARINDIENTGSVRSTYAGALLNIRRTGDLYVAAGWAGLTDKGQSPDAVLLTYQDQNGSAILFAIARLNPVERSFVSAIRSRNFFSYSRWSKSFSTSALGSDRLKISAWAFDASTGRAYKLEGEHVVDKSTDSEPN